jgi:hypothetical protein
MEQNGQRSKGLTERRILVKIYAAGLRSRPATLVRGSSRRITIVKASASSILEYQSDQPSLKPPSTAVPSAPARGRSSGGY